MPLSTGTLPPANGNNIINVLRDLGQPIAGFSDPYSRNIYVSPGRSYGGETEDYGHLARGRTGTSAARR